MSDKIISMNKDMEEIICDYKKLKPQSAYKMTGALCGALTIQYRDNDVELFEKALPILDKENRSLFHECILRELNEQHQKEQRETNVIRVKVVNHSREVKNPKPRRNMKETANKVKGKNIINDRYDLSADEFEELFRMITNNPEDNESTYDAILTAFYYGFVLGGRSVNKGGKVY